MLSQYKDESRSCHSERSEESPTDVGLKQVQRSFGLRPQDDMKKNIKASDLEVGMMLALEGQLEKVAHIKKVERSETLSERSESNGWIEEEVPVEKIEPGDEVLSLNEKTGRFEWHKVEAALFKGIQDLYELITSQGKRIRTTKEHPFYTTIIGNSNQDLRGSPLTNGQWLKVHQLKPGMLIATIDGWEQILSIKKVKRQRVYDLQVEGTHNFVGGHYIDTRSDQALSKKDEDILMLLLTGNFLSDYQEGEGNSDNQQSSAEFNLVDNRVKLTHDSLLSTIVAQTKHSIQNANRSVNSQRLGSEANAARKNPALRSVRNPDKTLETAGENIISLINEMLAEQEASFKAEDLPYIKYGGIVVHNTLIGIGGNVGIGWTSPTQLFQINPTYMGTQLTNPLPFVVTSTGNVGVGTTAPRSALDILAGSLTQTPQNPTFVGGANTGGNRLNSVFVSGRYAYVANGSIVAGCPSTPTACVFQIYDISNPSAPVFVGGSNLGATSATDMFSIFVSGKYAYIAVSNRTGTCSSTTNSGCELVIADISNPNSPLFVGGADLSNDANSVFVSGRYAYVGKSSNSGTCSSTDSTGCELQIYDISNPTSPVFVGGASNGNQDATSVFIAGKYVYLGVRGTSGTCSSSDFSSCELQIYDASNPTNPFFIGGVSSGVTAGRTTVFISGNYGYLGTATRLHVVDISTPSDPTITGTLVVDNTASTGVPAVWASGRYAYMIADNGNSGECNFRTSAGCELFVIDVSNPAIPTFIGGVDNGGGNNGQSLFISGRYLYQMKALNSGTCTSTNNGGCELQIYDISGIDVTSAQIGSLEAGGLQVMENAFVNNQLYVGGGLGVGPGGLLSQGMVGIGVSSGTTGLIVEMLGARGTGSTAPSAIFNGGNVGIGSTETATFPNLGSMLWVGGNVGIGWTNTGTATPAMPGLGLSVFGNVGIGTTSPAFGLQVIGNVGISSSLTVSNALVLSSYNCSGLNNGGKLTVNADGGVTCSPDAGAASAVDGSGALNQVAFWTDGDSLSGNNAFYWNNPLMRLGVGSSAPGSMLGVFGSLGIGSSFAFVPNSPNNPNSLTVEGNVAIGTTYGGGGSLIVMGGNVGIGWTSPAQLFQINATYMGTQLTNPLPFVVTSTGNVGVGTTAPRSALDILAGSLTQTPQNPTFIGGADIAANTNSIFVSGKYAYMASNATNELQIYDVTNPNSPASIGSADLGATGNSIYVSGKYAYIGRSGANGICSSTTITGCELLIYDVSNPANPIFIGGADGGSAVTVLSVFVSGRYAYVARSGALGTCDSFNRGGCEFQIYDVSNPITPVYAGGADSDENGAGSDAQNGIFVSGRYAFLVKNADGGTCNTTTRTGCELQIYDVSNPTNPTYVGGADHGAASGIYVSGRYAYVGKTGAASTCNPPTTNGGCEFQIWDISNPESPTFIGGASNGDDSANDIFVLGKYTYIVKNTNSGTCDSVTRDGCELQVYDVSNPTNVIYKGGADDGGAAGQGTFAVFVSGRYLYSGKLGSSSTCSSTDNTGCEFQIYDISGIDVTSATIGSLEAGALQVRESALINNQLYVGGGLGLGPGGLLSQGMVGIGVSSGTTGLMVEMLGARGTGSTAPSAIFNGGNVGIGSTETATFPNLSSMLWIGGNVGIGWTNTGTATPAMPGLGLSVFGNVGIGTTSPGYSLQVIGNSGIGASLTVSSALVLSSYNCSGLTNGGKLTVNADGGVTCSPDAGAASAVDGSGALNQVAFWTDGDSLSGNNAFYWNNPLMRLGVGSSAPGMTLGVFGSVGIGSSFAFTTLGSDLANGLAVQGNVAIGTTYGGGGSLIVMGGNVGIGWTSPSQLFQINPTYMGTQLTNPLPFTVTSTGNVGVGTTAPRSALDILAGSLLQTPQNPTFVGGANDGGNDINYKVFVSGRYAYVVKANDTGTCSSTVDTGCEFKIYDVSNPTSPTFVGGANDGGNDINNNVFVSGRYAYVVKESDTGTCSSTDDTGCEFKIYDVSNPTSPRFVGGASDGDPAYGVFVSGRYAYVVKGWNTGTCSSTVDTGCEFKIYDVSNPTSPRFVGGANDGGNNFNNDVFVSGSYVYVVKSNNTGTCSSTDDTGCEFKIYDVSNPTSPRFVGGANDSGQNNYWGVFVSGSYVYVVKSNNTGTCSSTDDTGCEFKIYDVSNPTSPTFVGGANDGGNNIIWDVFVSGRYAYLGKDSNAGACNFLTSTGCEIQVYDVSNPNNPLYVGGADSGGDIINGVFVSGRFIYTAKENNAATCSPTSNGGCELQVYDISGIDVTSAQIGSLESGSLQVRESAIISNQLTVGGGLGLGPGGLMSQGMVGLGVSSGTVGLRVEMLGVGTGYTAPAAIFNGGNVGINLGIGASTPGSTLFVGGNVGIGWTGYTFASMPGLGLSVFGGVGIGTTSGNGFALNVIGNVGISSSLTISTYACSGFTNGGKLTVNGTGIVTCGADNTLSTLNLGDVYNNDPDKLLAVDSTSGLTFNLTTTGDFVVQDSGTAVFQVLDSGPVLIGDQTVGATTFPRFADRTSAPTLATNGEFAIGDVGGAATSGRIWVRSNGTTWRFNSVASAADYSEYIKQQDISEPGDVMVLTESRANTSEVGFDSSEVKRSETPYDENIIGVITTRGTSNAIPEPYLSNDEPVGPEYANVGMLGEVWAKVSLENGPIYIGDPLTSSSTPGVAMKASKPGRIIGRAMEDYTAERDTVSSTGAPPYQILIQVNVTWWEPEQLIEKLDSGLLYLNGNLNIGGSATSKVGPDSFEVSLSVEGSIFSSNNILSLGNVGIGTTNPLYGLDVQKEASSSAAASIVNLSGVDNPDTSALRLGLGTPVSGISSNFIDFYANTSKVGLDSFEVDPVKVGRIRLNDNKVAYESVGADFAEYFEVSEEVEDGDLVSINDEGLTINDSSIINHQSLISKSHMPYDKNIVGVVSKDAAFVGNADYGESDKAQVTSNKKAIVGLLGQIKTKVSTINGEIKRGDYLTSSEIPGVAAKALRPGQVIGQALEDFGGDCFVADAPRNDVIASEAKQSCQGKISVLVKSSFADPTNFFASLSMDNEGNLIIPKLKIGSLQLEQTNIVIASTSTSLGVNSAKQSSQDTDLTQIASSMTPRNDTVYYDLTGKIASLENRVKSLESRVKEENTSVIATPNDNTATSSADLAQAEDTSKVGRLDSFEVDSLDLTPPDILLASDSATLTADLKVTSSAEILGTLTAYDAQIQNSLKSFGTTTLSDTLIAGTLTVDGTLSVENGNEINVIGSGQGTVDSGQEKQNCNLYPETCNLSGILYLQKSPLAQGIDIFNGKITLEKDGTIKATTIIVNQIKINQDKTLGTGLIVAGQKEAVVQNDLVDSSSVIVVTPNIPLSQTLIVVNNTRGKSFTVRLLQPETEDIKFDYLILGIATPAPLSQLPTTASGP